VNIAQNQSKNHFLHLSHQIVAKFYNLLTAYDNFDSKKG
jgi:hypothetical protein